MDEDGIFTIDTPIEVYEAFYPIPKNLSISSLNSMLNEDGFKIFDIDPLKELSQCSIENSYKNILSFFNFKINYINS